MSEQTNQPSGPSKLRRWIGAAILGAIVLSFAVTTARAYFALRGVVYYAEGTAHSAVVRYTNEQGQREQHEVRLPWMSRSVDVMPGTRVSIDAIPTDNGTVGCRINFNTDLVAERRDNDVGVLCDGFAGRAPR